MSRFDPGFVDFEAYMRAVYTPPPQLVAIGEQDPFWRTLGGSTERGRFGDDGETERQRAAAILVPSPIGTPAVAQTAGAPGANPIPELNSETARD